jgi:Uma2 family endonuclease
MEITSFDQLDSNATYSYADYLKWHFDERIELIKGKIFRMSPAPATRHQLYVGEIYRRLSNHLYRNSCKVFIAPFDVRLAPLKKTDSSKIYTVVQPDICVVCDPDKIDSKGCAGAPDLVVEVLSPGNTDKEMKEKFEIYEENGVKEYWLVASEILTSGVVEGLEVLVRDIFDV